MTQGHADDDTFFEDLARTTGDNVPRRVGPYDVLEVVASGGQGVVYRAEDRRDGEFVALKRPHLDGGSNTARLGRGAALAARLDHPGILPVKSIEEADGHTWVATPWIEGVTLERWLRERTTGRPEALRVFLRICDAIAHAHYRGVIHRDIRPPNVMIRDGGSPCVLDFGIAKGHEARGVGVTNTDGPVGNLLYTPPELLNEASPVPDVRHDIYALGLLLHVMLTGRHPLEGATPCEAFRRVSEGRLFGGIATPDVPASLGAIIRKATSSHTDSRYRSVQELAEDIERDRAGLPIRAVAHTRVYLLSRFLKRHKAPVAVAATALVVGTAFLAQRGHAQRTERDLRVTQARTLDVLSSLVDALGPAQQLGPVTSSRVVLGFVGDEVFGLDALGDPETELAIADAHHRIAVAFARLSRFREALPHAEAAHRVYLERGGIDHEATQRNGAVLARAIGEVQGYAQGEALTWELIGATPVDLVEHDEHLFNLAGAHIFQKEIDEGARYLETYLLRTREDPESHAKGLNLRAIMANKANRYEQSLRDSTRARELISDHFGPDHLIALESVILSAKSLQRMHRYDEEHELLEGLIPAYERVYGHGSAPHLQALAHLTIASIRLGRTDESLENAEHQLRLTAEFFGEADWRTIQARLVLADALLKAGRPEPVPALLEPEVERVYHLKRDQPLVRHMPRYWLARAYNETGRHARARDVLAPVMDAPRSPADQRSGFLWRCEFEALRAAREITPGDEHLARAREFADACRETLGAPDPLTHDADAYAAGLRHGPGGNASR